MGMDGIGGTRYNCRWCGFFMIEPAPQSLTTLELDGQRVVFRVTRYVWELAMIAHMRVDHPVELAEAFSEGVPTDDDIVTEVRAVLVAATRFAADSLRNPSAFRPHEPIGVAVRSARAGEPITFVGRTTIRDSQELTDMRTLHRIAFGAYPPRNEDAGGFAP